MSERSVGQKAAQCSLVITRRWLYARCMRALLVIFVLLAACAPPTTVSDLDLLVTTVDVTITGRCTGMPCDPSTFDKSPLIAPSSVFDAQVGKNSEGRVVVTTCDHHAVALVLYRATRLNTDGGTEVFEAWGGAFDTASTFNVNTQYGKLEDDGFNTFFELYAVRADGSLAIKTDATTSDGGVSTYDYKPYRYYDPDGGFLPSVREEMPFTFTETHKVSTTTQSVVEFYSECPKGPPATPYNPGWY